jgi:Arc/MetJ-type ribon-helix-helix transcriptional regulator
MTIEITRPEVEALIEQRLRSGVFSDAEDVILDALRSSAPAYATGAELVAAMQASPYKEIEIEPSRDRLPVRDVSF